MLASPTYKIGGLEIPMYPGDIYNTVEQPITINNAVGYQYTGADLVKGEIFRTGVAGAGTDTFPTAGQLIDALRGSINLVSPPSNELYGTQPNRIVQLAWPANVAPFQPGSTFRRIITETTAFAITMAVPANSGMTLAAAPYNVTAVAASSWREFIFQITNSSPTVTLGVGQVNTQFTLSVPNQPNLDMVNNITPGMSVYGTNIAANTLVTAVNRDTGIITLNLAVTATIALNPVTFTPSVTIYGLRSGTL